jgi:hypothetical protein
MQRCDAAITARNRAPVTAHALRFTPANPTS